jgi:hypothetical protein
MAGGTGRQLTARGQNKQCKVCAAAIDDSHSGSMNASSGDAILVSSGPSFKKVNSQAKLAHTFQMDAEI